jgi:hypothetical protein
MELHGWNLQLILELPRIRFKIRACIPINYIILSLLFDNGYYNIVVCTSFDTYITRGWQSHQQILQQV